MLKGYQVNSLDNKGFYLSPSGVGCYLCFQWSIVVYRKIVMGFALTGIVFAVPDLVFGLLHSLPSIAHVSYERISFILEEFIGHIFHFNKYQKYQSQLIVFYLWLSIASYGCYRLCRKVPGYCHQFMENC